MMFVMVLISTSTFDAVCDVPYFYFLKLFVTFLSCTVDAVCDVSYFYV